MDVQPTSKQGFTKPIGGMIVILLVALFVGGWLYVDMVRNELEAKIESVASEVKSVKSETPAVESENTLPTPAAEERRTYAGSLGEYRFQLDLPKGFYLSVNTGTVSDARAYVMSEVTENNPSPTPDMAISLISPKSEIYASLVGKTVAGTRLVRTPDGKFAFWIRGWEDMYWSESAKVAASLKAL